MSNANRQLSKPFYRAGFTGWFRGFFRTTIQSHPGYVSGAIAAPSLRGAWITASVEGDITAPSVHGAARPLAPKE